MPFCRNNLQVLLTTSDDDGVTWSSPVNITGWLVILFWPIRG
jgi:hypothetical protein